MDTGSLDLVHGFNSRELQFWQGPESQGCANIRRMHVIVFAVVAA